MKPPFRPDQVGSLLRPERLKAAREKFLGPQTPTSALGPHDNASLREVEDECVREVVAMQERIGLQAVTDGEFRRRSWWLELILGWEGFEADRTGSAKLKWRDASGPTQGFSDLNVVGPISIHHLTNSGIAFGLFSSATAVVILATSVAVAWMLYFFARSGARHPVLPIALGLVIGGSVSNLVDRVRLGHVTDFIDLKYWPAFNLADTFIVVGVAILLLALMAVERRPARPRSSHVREATRS